MTNKFYAETKYGGLPWTREGCNLRESGRFVPWPDREAAEEAVRERREDVEKFDDPAWRAAEYRIVPARE